MDLARLERKGDTEWWIPQHGRMRVPGVIYGSEPLVREMDEKVFEQVANVASLPGIQRASYAMPDAQRIGGVAYGSVVVREQVLRHANLEAGRPSHSSAVPW